MDDQGRLYILSEPNLLYRFGSTKIAVSEIVSSLVCFYCPNGLVFR